MQQWWLALVPIAAAAIGYVGRRHIERKSRTEVLIRRLQALASLRGMRREWVTLADLDRVECDAASGSNTKVWCLMA